MKKIFLVAAAAVLFAAPCALSAQAPAGATGKCKDGTYTTAASKRGACRGHKGVDTWLAADAAPAKASTPAATPAPAAAPASAPAGATGKCKDGTYTTAPTKRGACRGHKGVDTWLAADAAPAAPAASPAPAAAPTPAPAPTSASTPKPSATKSAKGPKTVAPGGGPGLVWVNTNSKVYHCYGGSDSAYGTTKAGKYESEAAAKAEGARPARGKVCSQ